MQHLQDSGSNSTVLEISGQVSQHGDLLDSSNTAVAALALLQTQKAANTEYEAFLASGRISGDSEQIAGSFETKAQ